MSSSQILILIISPIICFCVCFSFTLLIVSRVFYFSKNNLDPINSVSNSTSRNKVSKKNNSGIDFLDQIEMENKILERG